MKKNVLHPFACTRSILRCSVITLLLGGAFIECGLAQGTNPPSANLRMPQDSWYLAKEMPAGTVAKFSYPTDVAVGPDGNLYVADRANLRIQVLDPEGTLLRTWDGSSSQVPNGSFQPQSIHVASDGKVYVTDHQFRGVVVLDAQGKFLRAMGNGGGSGEGQFTWNMRGLAVDVAGNVYVGDNENRRVTVFDAEGNYLRHWGEYGDGDGAFYDVQDVRVLPDGNIAVLSGGRIQIFSPEGVFQTRLQTNEWSQYAFSTDADGNYYVFVWEGKMQKRSASGDLLAEFDLTGAVGNYSSGLSVADGRIYIADYNNHRIAVVGTAGNFIANWGVQGGPSSVSVFGLATDGDGNVFLADADRSEIRKYDPQFNLLTRFGSPGTGDGQFSGLRDVAVGNNGRLYALEQTGNRVQIFDLDGNFIGKFGATGTSDGRFQAPSGIAVGRDNKVYVADKDNHRIQIFDANGVFLGKFGREGSFDGEFKSPHDVATFPNGDIAVADFGNKRVQIFDHEGGFLRKQDFLNLARSAGLGGIQNDSGYITVPDRNMPVTVSVGSDGLLYVSAGTSEHIYSYTNSKSISEYFYGYPVVVSDSQLNGLKAWWPKRDLSSKDVSEWSETRYYRQSQAIGAGFFAHSIVGDLMVVNGDGQLRVWNRTSRTVQPASPNALPLPHIVSQQRRPGSSLVDVDYTVKDADNNTVHTAALAFKNGGNSLGDLIPITTLANGSILGPDTPTGSTHRFTWDAGQDLSADFSEVQFEILARDSRELLNLSFIQIPAIGDDPALKISISPLNDNDLLSVWYWLIATGDDGFEFSDGMVRLPGSAAPTDGLVATYFSNDDFTGEISTATGQLPSITTSFVPDDQGNWTYRTDLPDGTKSVRWSGFLKLDQPGNYAVYLDKDGNSSTLIRVGGAIVLNDTNNWGGSFSFTAASAGLVPISIDRKLPTSSSVQNYFRLSSWTRDYNWSVTSNLTLQDYKTAPGMLAAGTSTTDAGREFLFNKMGLREATAAEVLRAKQAGNPDAPIQQWDPKLRVGPDERPAKINAYGFDTGGSGYWVVPVNQNN